MASCPDYTQYSTQSHQPLSTGPLHLPFQRPVEACRRFASSAVESVITSISSKMANLDLARLFTNAYPNTLDTAIQSTVCIAENATKCLPLTFVITGDIDAMWLRDSANQVMPYLDRCKFDMSLKRMILGVIYMQAQFIQTSPYANAFHAPASMADVAGHTFNGNASVCQVAENKWEVDSLASFLSLSYQYWNQTGDRSFVNNTVWVNAVDTILSTIQFEQAPTFDDQGQLTPVHYWFAQTTDRATETQFNEGRGNPLKRTGMVRSLFRPSDDATLFPYFVPGNAMLSVELKHLAELMPGTKQAESASRLSREIREAIYKYAVMDHPDFGKVFAYEVDGYGSKLIMDDANVPSLLSLSWLGFVSDDDPIYQNTRRLVFSPANPYYAHGSRGSGIGSPHVGLKSAWPMSQIVRILTSTNETEIIEALDIIGNSTDGLGLIHESTNVHTKNDKYYYTRSWFSWANGLFGQAIIKLANERPHLIYSDKHR